MLVTYTLLAIAILGLGLTFLSLWLIRKYANQANPKDVARQERLTRIIHKGHT